MRESKQSDSPCGYIRDVYRKRIEPAIAYENTIRRRTVEHLERRLFTALVQQPHEYRDMDGNPAPNEDIAVDGLW